MAEVDIAELRKRLALHMERTGLKGRELSRRAGLNETAVRDLMDRVTDPRLGTITGLASALGTTPESLIGGLVQVAGCIRAGGEVVRAPECGCEAEFVPRPPEAIGELMAFKIDGDTLRPAYRDGDVVYIARNDDTPPDECVGDECVVQLAGSGALVLKEVAHGTTPGRFNLRSTQAADLVNVGIAWCEPILFVMRRRIATQRKMQG